jgi:cell wall-associated NlpC family hydrolase
MTVAMKIVCTAKAWVGTKYHHQGRLKKTDIHLGGVDCFGLIMGIAKELGIVGIGGKPLVQYDRIDYAMLPDGTRLKEFLDKHFLSVGKMRSGDILLFSFFGNPQHLGIVSNVIADDRIEIIHCYSGSRLVVQHYLSPAWIRMISGVYRFRGIK